MVNNKKSKEIQIIEEKINNVEEIILNDVNVESTDDDEKIEKPKKEKKPYVLTEARKQSFINARKKRAENIAIRNEVKTIQKKEDDQFIKEKEKLKQDKEKLKQDKIIKKEELKKLHLKIIEDSKVIETIESDTDDDEPIIVKKKKSKKPKVIYESESDNDSNNKHNITIINKIQEAKKTSNQVVRKIPLFL
tara:strand:+ start:323 stop:898 length:576 start_codon:yes stop_codon:yes gene_type:complete